MKQSSDHGDPHVCIEGLTIAYENPLGTLVAVSDASLAIDRGTFVTIVGPSGCGKSSLLMAVSGVTKPAKGRVLVNGRPVVGPGHDRAMVFQDFALLPWRTVLQNVRLGLELQRWNQGDRDERARQCVQLVGLRDFEHCYPHQLSGGMRQRVGIARALAVNPEILLMDEPFGSLDAQTREMMGNELLAIWERDRKTVLFVTHSIDEAVFLGDRVVLMSKKPGRVAEVLPIELPRPRIASMMDSEAYIGYRRCIRRHLMDQDGARTAGTPND